MNDLELKLIDLLARKADEVDISPLDGFAERLAIELTPTDAGTRHHAEVGVEITGGTSGARRRRARVVQGMVAVVCATAVVFAIVVAARNGASTPGDTAGETRALDLAGSPLGEPSRDEVALASNTGTYVPGSGPTEVTAAGTYASLHKCAAGGSAGEGCDGSAGWAYVTGSADAAAVHYGLLSTADALVLSALDDRLFVASAPMSASQDPPSAPAAWLIDSVTGQRGALTWQDQPTTLNSGDQALALFPAPNTVPFYTGPQTRFLPRVVDRRDWTIRPLRVPADASATLAIHQPGSGRIWIGTAPDGGDVGLAYTDDGGASWTDVELPAAVRPTSAELLAVPSGIDDLLVVAATGARVAVMEKWTSRAATDGQLLVSDDAGANWNTVTLDPAPENGRGLFVLADGRLMVAMYEDLPTKNVLVSGSALDWSRLAEAEIAPGSPFSEILSTVRSRIEVYQDGTVLHYELAGSDGHLDSPVKFSTDLHTWWTIPGLILTCTNC